MLLASGQLPHGHCGATNSRKLCSDMEAFAAIVATHVTGKPLPPVMVDRAIGDWTLSGRIDGLNENGLACYRPAPLQPKDMLKIWILHLVLNCTKPSVIGPDRQRTDASVSAGRKQRRALKGIAGALLAGLARAFAIFPEKFPRVRQMRRSSQRKEEIRRQWQTPNGWVTGLSQNKATPTSISHSGMFPRHSISSGKSSRYKSFYRSSKAVRRRSSKL